MWQQTVTTFLCTTTANGYVKEDILYTSSRIVYIPSRSIFRSHMILPVRAVQFQTITGGTSAATPIWGGVLALLNDHLLKNGKGPVGYVI